MRPIRSQRLAAIGLCALFTAILAVASLGLPELCQGQEKNAEPKGKILNPKDGAQVTREKLFDVKAEVTSVPAGHRVYPCTEIEGLGLWPKDPLTQYKPGGDWSGKFVEGGTPPDGLFRLTLILVPPSGIEILEAWFKNGRRDGNFPPFSRLEQITGAKRLDSVQLKLR